MEHLLELFSDKYAAQLRNKELKKLEEIRLHTEQPVMLRFSDHEEELRSNLSQSDIDFIMNAACRQSIYAHTETLCKGYVTIEGGHRIGICGFGVMKDGQVQTIRNVSSICIRVANQIIGCANQLLPLINGSTLILGPPGAGKTTLLRDLVRQLSDKRKQRIALADERCELSAGAMGRPQLQIGRYTDVMLNIPKGSAAMLLLRTMNPQWIAMDEITSKEDLSAMEHIAYCGVHILATAHGTGMKDLSCRPLYRDMMQRGIFQTIVILDQEKHYIVQEVSS